MLTASESGTVLAAAEGTTAASTSWVEMSDEEILAWLTTSILDEPEPGERGDTTPETIEFWDQVAAVEASLAGLGHQGAGAVQQAIGLIGLRASLEGAGAGSRAPASFGVDELERVQSELVERAGRAVALWATLQGSALRAAAATKG